MLKQPGPDAEVLGSILLLQNAIQAQPDDRRMAEVLVAGLLRIPGIGGAAVCKDGFLLGACALVLDPPLKCQEAFRSAAPHPACPQPGGCADRGCVRLSLQSARRSYGGMLLKVTDEAVFGVYRPLLESTTSLAALLMENREREADLRRRLHSLEPPVWERSAGLPQEPAERHRIEEALRASEARLRTIIDTEPECVKLLALDGRLLQMNPSGLAMIEADSLEEAQRRPLTDYVVPEHRSGFVDYLKQVMAGHRAGSYAFEAVGLKGTRRWLETNAVPWRDEANEIIGLLGITRDITWRKRAEEDLSKSEARYRGLFSAMQEGFSLHEIICDEQGTPCDYRYLDVNPAFERITGIPRDRWIGRRVREVLPQIEPRWIEQFGQVALTGQPLRYEDFVKELDRHYAVIVYCPQPGQFAVVSWDVTERKRAEEELRQSQAMLQSIFRSAPVGIGVVNHRILGWTNERLSAMTGYSPAEMQGQSARLFYPTDEEYAYVGRAKYEQIRQQGTGTVETRWRRKDGVIIDVLLSSTPMVVNDHSQGVTFTALDITERKRIELALRESEDFLTRSQSVARIGAYRFEIAANIWTCTPALDRLFGIDTRHPKTFEGWLELVVPEQRPEMQRYLLQYVVAERHRFEREYRIIRRDDGQERWVSGMGELEFDAQGQPIRMIGTIQDITDRKQAESALRESEDRFAVFMNHLPAGVFMKDVPGHVVYANAYLCDLFGWGNALGQTTRDLLPPELAEKMEADDRAVLLHGPVTLTEQVRDGANRERIFQTSKFPIAREGRPPLLGGITVDITERKQAEDALRDSLEEKEALLKEVHHRVKNNLQIISSLLNLMARNIQSPEVQDFIRDTQSRIRAMALLHETLYGSGNLARVSFRRYVDSVCAYVARSYASDALQVRLRPDIADVALTLDQAIPAGLIINELVSNSLKHAFVDQAEGELIVQLQVADEHHYLLRVADNGVGLPATTDPQTTGTLGLRLVESLVRQLNGQMSVTRDPGTTFQILFPMQSAHDHR